MSDIYLMFFILGVVLLLFKVALKGERVFEYPYFMAAVFTGFLLPQAFSLIRFPGKISSSAIDAVLLMTCLCLASCVLGYMFKPSAWVVNKLTRPFLPEKMLHVGAFFVACGYVFGFLLAGIEVEFNEARGGMTGVGTIYLFFASLKFPGLAICLSLLLQQFTFARLVLTILAVVSPLGEIIIGGRREPAMVVALIIMFCLYFYRGFKPSRILIFLGLFFIMLAIPATGLYRSLVKEGGLQQVRKLDLVGNFKNYFSKDSILELRNAAATIEICRHYSRYEYGVGYWNQLIFRFVPAQLVGKDIKDKMVLGGTVEDLFQRNLDGGFEFSSGSTVTGIGDSFNQFGWFGCLFFAVLGWFFKSAWSAALKRNALFAQILYLLICTSAMRALTHQTVDFLPGFAYQFLFLALGQWYAKDRGGRGTYMPRRSSNPHYTRFPSKRSMQTRSSDSSVDVNSRS